MKSIRKKWITEPNDPYIDGLMPERRNSIAYTLE